MIKLFIWEFPVYLSETVNFSTYGLVAKHTFDKHKNTHRIQSRVINAEDVRGAWSFKLDNGQVSDKVIIGKDQSATGVFKQVAPGERTASIQFEGRVDGKRINLKQTLTFTAKEHPEPPIEYTMNIKHRILLDENKEPTITRFIAFLPEAENKHVRGNWTFEVNEEKKVLNHKEGAEQSVDYPIDDFDPGKTYHLRTLFEGKINGSKRKVEKTYTLTLPGMEMKAPLCINNKLEISANLTHTETAKGKWYIDVMNDDGEKFVDHESEEVRKTGYFHSFSSKDLKKLGYGMYSATVVFYGTVDGNPVSLYTWYDIEVKNGAPCLTSNDVLPGNGKKPKEEKSDTGNKTKSGDTVMISKKKGKEIVHDLKKGGKLPKTSADYPSGILIGATLFGLGGLLFASRRKKRWMKE